MKAIYTAYTLQFKQASGTSRGVLKTKKSFFIKLALADGQTGLGECGILAGLSADDRPHYEQKLKTTCQAIKEPGQIPELIANLNEWPSIKAGLEMAWLDLNSKNHVIFPSLFTQGKATQPINGLIWMGDETFMKAQIKKRLAEGFTVLKMKIGAIDWPTELKLLKHIRQSFSAEELELRVDANGAFLPAQAPAVLEDLAKLKVHSIEQPIKPGQWQSMAKLCQNSPVPIALDEELIGLFKPQQRQEMMRAIKPHYIILKPSFLGGFAASTAWIGAAKDIKAGYWVTSALESNLGLSALAQWNFTLQNPMHSGLGTGSLYTNNFASPLEVKKGAIAYNPEAQWNLDALAF
jgi:o-succinylbenzoate synthase